ncbi:MAG: MraY family glycosyltransferase [Pseudomonadota bacterium]|nr:MraY family glycosyltransferase [Pseudomonadota bacterium]
MNIFPDHRQLRLGSTGNDIDGFLMIILSTSLLALFITLALVPLFRNLAVKLRAVDIPEPRKVHQQPMPKTGGLAMAAGALIPIILWVPSNPILRPLLLSSAVIIIFGFLDDVINLGFKAKFAAQFFAALIVVLYGGVRITSLGALLPDGLLLPVYLSVPLTIFVIVGVTNAINLADGLDGLAGGISLLIFACISLLAYQCGDLVIALMTASLAGAIFGFLRFNTFPATVFMGDAGSQFLGFLAITLSLSLTQKNIPYSPLLPLLLLGFPVFDTLTVMLGRIYHGKSPFKADTNHFHHKMMRLGFYHSEAVLIIYIIQILLVSAVYFFRFYSDWWLLSGFIFFAGLMMLIFYLSSRYQWKFQRGASFFDLLIKGKLRRLKEQQVFIKASFIGLQLLIPLVLLLTCLLPAAVPRWLGYAAFSMLIGLLLSRFLLKKLLATVIRLSIYITTPALIFLGSQQQNNFFLGMAKILPKIHLTGSAVMVFFVMLVVRLSRRSGYKSTPLDFLILFIALVVPNLSTEVIGARHMGVVASQIIALFYSYEVLLEELRGEYNLAAASTGGMLLLSALRGLMG